jgi:hypothetical protein
MQKIILIVILSALFIIGCSNTTSTNTTANPELIFREEGSGDPVVGMSTEMTETFHVSKTEWYIETNINTLDPSNSVGFTITVFPKGKSADGQYIGAINEFKQGLDKTYFKGTGDFYLVIVANNIKTWAINVYQ